jgi:drug/metabolite transporter (DMT)-like permease
VPLFNKIPPLFLAAISIALWGTLAALGKQLAHIPPFLLVGIALCIGGGLGMLVCFRQWREWTALSAQSLGLGVYGLFGFHFFLFLALQRAPAIEANLINYLWPLLIVLLSPVIIPNTVLTRWHVVGGGLGFMGAVALLMGSSQGFEEQYALGYGCAAVSALIWATYSLLTKRLSLQHAAPSSAVGLYCLVSGVLSLLCHRLFEPSTGIASTDWPWLLVLGAGPMGLAFFAWDAALQRGDVRTIGALSYVTPLLSTAVLWLIGAGALGWNAALALVLIIAGAVLASQSSVKA